MTNRNRLGVVLLIAVVGLAGLGCGSAELEAENQRLEGELEQLRQDHRDKMSELQERIGELEQENSQIADLMSSREDLRKQLEAMRERERQQKERLAAFRNMLKQFREMIEAGQLRVKIVRGKMVVELPEGVLFDSGSAELKDDGQETLEEVTKILAGIENRDFLVAGHTDNVPISSRKFPSNWELSAERGVVVAKFMAENGMPKERIAAAGYADTQPVASNESDDGRAANRRIEIILMPNLNELPDMSALEEELEDDE